MSDQSSHWYIPGDGQQPAGPFSAEQIIQSWRAGRVDANTICWREGMPEWRPLSQVEPFASAVRSASAGGNAPARAAPSPTSPKGMPPLPVRRARSRNRLNGAIIAACAVAALIVVLIVIVGPVIWARGSSTDDAGEGSSTAAPLPSQGLLSDAQVLAAARREIQSKLLHYDNSWYGYLYFTGDRPARLVEIKGLSMSMERSSPLSPADKANGIQWQGAIVVEGEMYRTMNVDFERGNQEVRLTGSWSDWKDGSRNTSLGRVGVALFFDWEGLIALTVRNGRWEWRVNDADKPNVDPARIPK